MVRWCILTKHSLVKHYLYIHGKILFPSTEKKNADLAFFTFEWKSETYVCAEFN